MQSAHVLIVLLVISDIKVNPKSTEKLVTGKIEKGFPNFCPYLMIIQSGSTKQVYSLGY